MLNLSTIEQRRILLDEALDTMEENAVIFLDNARNFSKNPHDPMNVEFQKKTLDSSKNYCKGLYKIIQVLCLLQFLTPILILEASNILEDSPFRNFFAAIEYIQVLIVIAHKLFKSSSLFCKYDFHLHMLHYTFLTSRLVAAQGKGMHDLDGFVEVLEGYLNRTMDVCRRVMDKVWGNDIYVLFLFFCFFLSLSLLIFRNPMRRNALSWKVAFGN
jgi:hypothetical protein